MIMIAKHWFVQHLELFDCCAQNMWNMFANKIKSCPFTFRGSGSKASGHRASGAEATNLGQTIGKWLNFAVFMKARGLSPSLPPVLPASLVKLGVLAPTWKQLNERDTRLHCKGSNNAWIRTLWTIQGAFCVTATPENMPKETIDLLFIIKIIV